MTTDDEALREHAERVLQKVYMNTWEPPSNHHLVHMLMREIKAGYQRGREDERREQAAIAAKVLCDIREPPPVIRQPRADDHADNPYDCGGPRKLGGK